MTERSPVTIHTLAEMKSRGERGSCIALYDASLARIASAAGTDVLLVGDSLGMTVQGHTSTLPVTIDHMVYHTEAVARGNVSSLVLADMPFMASYTPSIACENAAKLMRAGAHMVKIEGERWMAPLIEQLGQGGIPVCAHLGLTPQAVHRFGGYRIQGRGASGEQLLRDGIELVAAGAHLLLLECVPEPLAARVAAEVAVPVIGIGAGAQVDLQVLVANDMLGITPRPPRFSHNFLADHGSVEAAFSAYISSIKAGDFPKPEHWFA